MANSLEATCKLSEKMCNPLSIKGARDDSFPSHNALWFPVLTTAYTKHKSNKITVRGELISSSMTVFKCLEVCVCFSNVTTK